MKNYLVISFVLGLALLGGCKKGGSGGPTGVEACDSFLVKATACAEKVGGPEGESMKRMLGMQKDMWIQKSKDGAQKELLPDFCKMALDSAKEKQPTCAW
ncbi:MAG: hypothetical protein ACTHU0_25185 [Kofleriaceae bacterium]